MAGRVADSALDLVGDVDAQVLDGSWQSHGRRAAGSQGEGAVPWVTLALDPPLLTVWALIAPGVVTRLR